MIVGARGWAAVGAFALGACQTWSARPDVPALITSPTPASRSELARTVSRALNGVAVTLADDALTGEDTLIVERARPRDLDAPPLTGRETGRPEHFRLVKNGSRCVLVHEGSGRRYTLTSATCAPK